MNRAGRPGLNAPARPLSVPISTSKTSEAHDMPPPILTATELADEIGESYESVLEMSKQGIIRPIRTGGRHLYFNLRTTVESVRRYHRERAKHSQEAEATAL
jgi:hypothetical protein